MIFVAKLLNLGQVPKKKMSSEKSKWKCSCVLSKSINKSRKRKKTRKWNTVAWQTPTIRKLLSKVDSPESNKKVMTWWQASVGKENIFRTQENLAEIALKLETFKKVEYLEDTRKREREGDFSIYIIDKRSDDDAVLGNKVYRITSKASQNR